MVAVGDQTVFLEFRALPGALKGNKITPLAASRDEATLHVINHVLLIATSTFCNRRPQIVMTMQPIAL